MAIYNSETGFSVRDSQLPFVSGMLPPKLEKHYMNPVRFLINYRIIPGFGIICGLILIAILVLMEMSEGKYAGTVVLLYGVLGLLCIALLLTVPITRKWEISEEMKRYDFSPLPIPLDDPWVLKDEGITLQFTRDGLRIDDQFYWYNHLKPRLSTSNRFNRIWVALQFGSDPMHTVFLPLSPEAITAVAQFSIPLENKDAYHYLLNNKERVFEQIYKVGSFYTPEADPSTDLI